MSTDTLIDFLVSEGAEVADGVVVSFANEPAHDADAAGLKVPLRSYGVVAVTGDDAEAFLQGQFAGDCQALAVGASMLTAWCNPKGRVIVLVHLIRSDAGFHLLVEREQLAAFRQRLSMFVLRADVVIEDLSASHGVVQIETVDGDAASFDAGDLNHGTFRCTDLAGRDPGNVARELAGIPPAPPLARAQRGCARSGTACRASTRH